MGPAFLSNFSRLQLIQNSVPSVTGRRQCDIRIRLLEIELFIKMKTQWLADFANNAAAILFASPPSLLDCAIAKQ